MKKKTEKQTSGTEELAADQQHAVEAESESGSAEQERDRLQDQLKRAMADLQNIRKRHVKEMEDARRRAVEGLAAELLPVLDNFELALAAHEQRGAHSDRSEEHAMVEGVRMVRSLLQGVLERHGLAEIPAAGVRFDPNVHEAVGMDPQAEVEAGHVSKVMLQGYSLGERVIRPAKVIVSGSSQGGAAAEDRGDAQPTDDESES